jgi:hypothetical protein
VNGNRTRVAIALLPLLLLFVLSLNAHGEAPEIIVASFSVGKAGGSLPSGWNPWILKNVKRPTAYTLVRDGGTVVKAVADASASGLMRDIEIDPGKYPIVRWRWKAANIIQEADISLKKTNDSPARLYIAFAYDMKKLGLFERLKYTAAKRIYSKYLPLRAIAYTWGNRTPKGAFVPMPYTGWFKQIVLENETSPINGWINEERDVYRDYRKAFGEDPGKVTGVAIMTNTDNMGGKATAWYGDIVFRGRDGQ